MKTKKTVKLIGKVLFYAVFIAVLLLVIGMAVAKMSNRVFFIGDRATIWVMTDSMEDTIPAQSYIQIRKIDTSDIKKDDIITFYSDDPALQGNLNTHRVLEVLDGGEKFITIGDNTGLKDKYPARAESVVGVYEKNLKGLTSIGRIFQTKMGLIIILVVMAALITASFAADPIKQLVKNKRKNIPSSEEQK